MLQILFDDERQKGRETASQLHEVELMQAKVEVSTFEAKQLDYTPQVGESFVLGWLD